MHRLREHLLLALLLLAHLEASWEFKSTDSVGFISGLESTASHTSNIQPASVARTKGVMEGAAGQASSVAVSRCSVLVSRLTPLSLAARRTTSNLKPSIAENSWKSVSAAEFDVAGSLVEGAAGFGANVSYLLARNNGG